MQAFDTLDLADVYAVLSWALRHLEDMEAYLSRREEEAAQRRRTLEEAGLTPTREESGRLKEKLMVRRDGRQRQRAGDATLSDG